MSDEPQVEGKLRLVEGSEEELVAMLNFHALISIDGEWLVPGVPEAKTANQALDAVSKFKARLRATGKLPV
ncbi:hypothetical protein [Shimia sp. R9_3]|uniref:hypothetical protein n=1 Tax=Shimia sp. R9_3 TaxID=2821113 RepID=UPI001AD98CC2|nr:hypothetical protein [Shimia sp. R9_3]MBO9403396.1 hypothetical protein [Shimia sp. R9_3]